MLKQRSPVRRTETSATAERLNFGKTLTAFFAMIMVVLFTANGTTDADAAGPEWMLEKVGTASLKLTEVTDFGTAFADILSGKVAPPKQGARVDVGFEGRVTGKIAGTIKGVDHLHVRADGRTELNIFAQITTDDGARIFYEATGISTPRADGLFVVREYAKLTTSFKNYSWVNDTTMVAHGTVDPAKGMVELTFYN